MAEARRNAVIGALFALAAVLLTSTTDLMAKLLAGSYPVQQVNFLSALIGIAGSWLLARRGGARGGLRTAFPGAMAMRSIFTVLSAACYYVAYTRLQLTEVFVFGSLLPIFTGLFSGPMLGERLQGRHWLALGASVIGVMLVLPAPGGAAFHYYILAFLGSLFGALSLTFARVIGREENNPAALVFYPQVALAVIMGVMLPGHFVPMGWGDAALVLIFGLGFLFGRLALAAAFARAAAMVVAPIVNLQFFVLLGFGYLVFGDVPGQPIYLGAALVLISGFYVTFGARLPLPAPPKIALPPVAPVVQTTAR